MPPFGPVGWPAPATDSSQGLMSATDKTYLDNMVGQGNTGNGVSDLWTAFSVDPFSVGTYNVRVAPYRAVSAGGFRKFLPIIITCRPIIRAATGVFTGVPTVRCGNNGTNDNILGSQVWGTVGQWNAGVAAAKPNVSFSAFTVPALTFVPLNIADNPNINFEVQVAATGAATANCDIIFAVEYIPF